MKDGADDDAQQSDNEEPAEQPRMQQFDDGGQEGALVADMKRQMAEEKEDI
jgi:hypothetical protein